MNFCFYWCKKHASATSRSQHPCALSDMKALANKNLSANKCCQLSNHQTFTKGFKKISRQKIKPLLGDSFDKQVTNKKTKCKVTVPVVYLCILVTVLFST